MPRLRRAVAGVMEKLLQGSAVAMLKLVVLDRSAESRNRIIGKINRFLQQEVKALEFLPQISVKPLAVDEIKFHAAPDICIIGEQIISDELTEVGRIKKLLPDTALLAVVNEKLASISLIEQLARLGVDDTLSDDIAAVEFLRKLVILSKRRKKAKSGKLIVVASGKGGLGVTSIVAALGESLAAAGTKTALLDFDFETQDLSRFLQARPFINENLQMLFDLNRPVTQEFVEQCLVPVWHQENDLACMAPPAETEDLYDANSSHSRTLLSLLEILDALYECVIVDVGCARGALLKTLLRVADKTIFVINNDPASLYASVERLARVRSCLAPDAELLVVENAPSKNGLSNKFLRHEFTRAARLESPMWLDKPIPFCIKGNRWPGSGASLYSQSKRSTVAALNSLRVLLNLTPSADQQMPDPVSKDLSSGAFSLIKNYSKQLTSSQKSQFSAELKASNRVEQSLVWQKELREDGKQEQPPVKSLPLLPSVDKAEAGTEVDVTALISGVQLIQ